MVAQPPPSPGRLLAGAVASGVATALLPPARLPLWLRRCLHVGLGVAAAGATAWKLGRPEEPVEAEDGSVTPPLPPSARLAVGTFIGVLVSLSSAVGTNLDTAAEAALVRRGVRRPRLWIGTAAAALTAAMSWTDARRDVGSGDR